MTDDFAAHESNAGLPASELDAETFRAVFDASPRPLLLIAPDSPRFTMVAVNQAHAMAFRTTPQALIGLGVFEVFSASLPADADAFVEAVRASFERVVATREPDQMSARRYATRTEHPSSQERFASATNIPILSPDGTLRNILSAVQDVTGEVLERRSETARSLLMREVDHRARNALAIVQSIIRLTRADNLEDFREVVSGRVSALARAQTSLAARRWEGAALREIIESEISPFADASRYSIAGPHVLLSAHHVQAMSMVVHELTTNAVKYGCLCASGGQLIVAWSAEGEGRLRLRWTEEAGPTIEPPQRTGFGTRLIGDLTRQLGGAVEYDWRPQGLCVELVLKPD